jgi:predicted MFS family arabinose efflux permease
MSCPTVAAAAPPAAARPTLSPRAAFALQTSITVSFLAGSSAPTPLYPTYQAMWGFSPVMVTVVFGAYAIAVLAALLVAGRLSDHVGRRPVLIAATLVQAATMLLFACADGLDTLLWARVLQGLSGGAAMAAVGAGLLDLHKIHGAVANSVAPPLGTASGAVVAGLMVQYLPAPTHLVYAVLGVLILLQGLAVRYMAETATPRPGAWASLKPQLRLPAHVRGPLLRAVPALVATWSLAGFYGALSPSLVRGVLGTAAPLLAGLTLFVLAISGGSAVLLLRNLAPRTMTTVGALSLLFGLVLTLAALSQRSMALLLCGASIAGVGFGAGFQGAVRSVVVLAEPHERAGVLSLVFVVAYLAMGLPAVGAGYVLTRTGDVLTTAGDFSALVMLLAAMALAGAWWKQPR